MHAKLEYPVYSLEIYLSKFEKEKLLLGENLDGKLEFFLRVFPAFNEGFEGFIQKQGKLTILFGKYLLLTKKEDCVELILNKTNIEKNIWDCNSQRYCHGGVYFNFIN